jgi:hypothetical protein
MANLEIDSNLADFLHDNFKEYRTWSSVIGWIFDIDGLIIFERKDLLKKNLENTISALQTSSPYLTSDHRWKDETWSRQRLQAIQFLKGSIK